MSDKKLNYEYMKKAMHEAVNNKKFTEARLQVIKDRKTQKSLDWVGNVGFGASAVLAMGGFIASAYTQDDTFAEIALSGAVLGFLGTGIAPAIAFAHLKDKIGKNVEFLNYVVRKNYIKQEFKQEFIDQGQTEDQAEANLTKLATADYETKVEDYENKIDNYEKETGKDFQMLDFVDETDKQTMVDQETDFGM